MVGRATLSVMEITVREAAARLGVSERQVQRLARAGRLQIVRRVGSTYLLDDSGMERSAAATRGRIWAPVTAWAAIDLLQTGSTDRLHGSALSRLRRRLRECDAKDLTRLAAGRAQIWRGTQTRRSRDSLRAEVALSGESLLTDEQVARQFGLVAGDSGRTEGYVTNDRWPQVRARFGLEADADGEVLVHVTSEAPRVGAVLCALDLAERWSARERMAGLRWLDERLQACAA